MWPAVKRLVCRNTNTRKTEKIERHESAPRPELPDAVAEALAFDEPDVDAVDVSSK